MKLDQMKFPKLGKTTRNRNSRYVSYTLLLHAI